MRTKATSLLLILVANCTAAADWPAWRGAEGIGVSIETNLPVRWSTTENVRWRVALPEPGNSTPIVCNDRVFVTQAVGSRRTLMCFRRDNGELLWQQGTTTARAEPTHSTNPYCSASPATDGERVVASFASDGLFCYDHKGRELWKRTDLGRQIHIWGAGSSPVLHGDLCFLNFGPGETTYLLAVNKATGQTVWRQDEPTGYAHPTPGGNNKAAPGGGERDTFIGSWSTPVLMNAAGRDQLLLSWPRRLAAYDPQTGDELWSCSGLNPLAYTSPIFSDGIVVAMGGFNGISLAVRAGGSGDVTEARRIWLHPKTQQRIGSGVISDGHVYIHNEPGVAECYELDSGNLVWKERLAGPGGAVQNWSSVLLGAGNAYTINQGGDCFVFRASPKFELLATNSLGEKSNSSIVASNGELFIRTHQALWCIGAK